MNQDLGKQPDTRAGPLTADFKIFYLKNWKSAKLKFKWSKLQNIWESVNPNLNPNRVVNPKPNYDHIIC